MEHQRPEAVEGTGNFVEFLFAGQAAKGEFRCSDCGYGVAIWKALPRCPMCGGEAWERAGWAPFTRSRELI